MIIFDNEYLKQYIELGVELKVYVNREWYTVTDISDVESPQYGLAIDRLGKPITFKYPSIEQIMADNKVMTIDQLNDKATGQEDAPDDDPEADGGDKPEPGGGGSGPQDKKTGKPSGGGGGAASGPPDDEESDTPEPPREAYLRVVANMIQEAKKKAPDPSLPFNVDDFVENIDGRSEYAGSRGVVTEVTKAKDDGGMTTVEYRVFNYGFNFKPGIKVTVPASALSKIKDGNDGTKGT